MVDAPPDTPLARYASVIHRTPDAHVASRDELDDVVGNYCERCHNDRRLSGNLSLVGFELGDAVAEAETAEMMIRKLRAGMMPPPGARSTRSPRRSRSSSTRRRGSGRARARDPSSA